MKYKVIITGATGMIGKGVLLECLSHQAIEKVLVVNRTQLGMEHPKLQECILDDFMQPDNIREDLSGYDACFFCLGVSSVGMDKDLYEKITFRLTKGFADLLFELNPNMVFNYVSGTGTDSSEKGRVGWARVKGKTENYILQKGFRGAWMFRPGMVIPEKGIRAKTGWYNLIYDILRPLFPLMKKSQSVTSTSQLGLAMIQTILAPPQKIHLENPDINQLAKLAVQQ